jgi:hypothetical protein
LSNGPLGCADSRQCEQVANEIGTVPLVEHLRAIVSACNQAGTIPVEELALRQRIAEAVLLASLDVDRVVGEIDNERAQILDVRAQLSSGRDRKINLLSLANIAAGTGSGVIGTAMQFSDQSQKKIDLLTSRIGKQKHPSIDLLTDRSAMLLDLRARVLLMKRDLRDLIKSVSAAHPAAAAK